MYYDAVSIFLKLQKNQGSLKSLVFKQYDKKNSKQMFALVCETLKYMDILDELIQKTNLMQHVKVFKKNEWLARVLVFDLLFGKGIHGKFKVMLDKHKVSLQSNLARMKIKAKVSTNKDLLASYGFKGECVPRYVRVNALRGMTTEEAIKQLSTEYTLLQTGSSYENFIENVKNISGNQFLQDIHVPNLLIFRPGSNISEHQMYKDGKIIVQDKASCLPAYVLSELNIPFGSHAIDCCAAPGNKTTHLAAILQNTGKIFAFDKDHSRLESMHKLLQKAGTSGVETVCQDFLKVDTMDEKYSKVEYAIVDPSCSGSGIVSRLNGLTDTSDSCSKERLRKLSNFQVSILKHALSFPSIQYAVYSTCSIHEEENEQVIQTVLEELNGKFHLINILPDIPHRGLAKYKEIGPMCVRLNTEKDLTNGFFVGCFKRSNENELITENQQDLKEDHQYSNSSNKPLVTTQDMGSDKSYNFKKIKKKIKIGEKRKIVWDDNDVPNIDMNEMNKSINGKCNDKTAEVLEKSVKVKNSHEMKKKSERHQAKQCQNQQEKNVQSKSKKHKKKKKHSKPVTK